MGARRSKASWELKRKRHCVVVTLPWMMSLLKLDDPRIDVRDGGKVGCTLGSRGTFSRCAHPQSSELTCKVGSRAMGLCMYRIGWKINATFVHCETTAYIFLQFARAGVFSVLWLSGWYFAWRLFTIIHVGVDLLTGQRVDW